MRNSILILAVTALIFPTICAAQTPTAPPTFYLGADISSLASGPGRGGGARGPGYRENGQPATEYAIMLKHGWNTFRLRVFLSPVRQAPNNSLENTIPLAKQIKAAGGLFMLDIHYSDTWADPQHQETPVAWRNFTAAEMEKQIEDYSKDVIAQFKSAGAMPDMVQVGNEITGGMLWPLGHVRVPPSGVKAGAGRVLPLPDPYDDAKQWDNLIHFIKAGIRGVRAGADGTPVKIIMHIDCGGDWPVTQSWFDHLTAANVDYDIIGQSFYPNYHGTLSMLQNNIIESTRKYHKPFIVAETGYSQSGGTRIMSTGIPTTGPSAREKGYMQWPGTPQGQLQFMTDLVNTVQRAGGSGVFYWAPEGFGRGNGMWNPDGSPAPSIFVLDNLKILTTQPASRLPDAPAP